LKLTSNIGLFLLGTSSDVLLNALHVFLRLVCLLLDIIVGFLFISFIFLFSISLKMTYLVVCAFEHLLDLVESELENVDLVNHLRINLEVCHSN